MAIFYEEQSKEFHLCNKKISYIMKVLPNGQIGNLYYGKVVNHKKDFSYLLEGRLRSLAVYTKENDYFYSPQYTKMEYPDYGRGDFREPAYEVLQENGSCITSFVYKSHVILEGKDKLEGLPALYVDDKEEADTLLLTLVDEITNIQLTLKYTIFRDEPVIARSVSFQNNGAQTVVLKRALSANVDLPDAEFEMIQLSGAWSRERHIKERKLQQGIQGIGSKRGISSAEHNPFIALKRKETNEFQGEVYAFSLIYSGNHIEQVEVDTNNMTRVLIGIHPDTFSWNLSPKKVFQTPEAVLVYSEEGLNGMSQVFHNLFAKHLIRSAWRKKERPILINNWEATGADFTEEQILKIAKTGQELGMELFVLDDGWFGNRNDDKVGLGDWYVKDFKKLPHGIEGIAQKIESLGMKFGLWFEPEMVNKDSDTYREHPDWILHVPNRDASPSRNQYVLDFSKSEVIEHVYKQMQTLLKNAPISYIKWDMNRYITECYSVGRSAEEQGEIFHRYILGVYQLYERLTKEFSDVLFESCSSGGARFDPGILYYAPQTWTSDNTDAYERVMIQYGTSYVYPIHTMGAHVSEVPNQQVGRLTPIETRANVAMFGVFGYELDLNELTEEEKRLVREQILFYKEHRRLFQYGTFYRLQSPFEYNESAWMTVSENQEEAMVGYYRRLGMPNGPWLHMRLKGLDENMQYCINGKKEIYSGSELMHIGLVIHENEMCNQGRDFSSVIYWIKKVKE